MAQSTALTPFEYTGHTVRTVLIDDEPWFVAADVCSVLTLQHTGSALRMVDDDDKHTLRRSEGVLFPQGIDSRVNELTFVNESGVYALIFHSNKPEAKAFKRWVTHEVLPTLRRTGTFSVAQLGRRELAQMVIEEADRADRAEQRVAELEPAANAWDKLASASGDLDVAQAAKVLSRDPAIQLGRDRLFTVMAERRWIHRGAAGRWTTYQAQIDNGRLSVLPSSHYHPRTGELVLDPPQVRVTVKGLTELHRLLGGTAPLAMQEQLDLIA